MHAAWGGGQLKAWLDTETVSTLSAGRGAIKAGINRRARKLDGCMVLGRNPGGLLDSEVLVWRFDSTGPWARWPAAADLR